MRNHTSSCQKTPRQSGRKFHTPTQAPLIRTVECDKCGLDPLCALLAYDEGDVELPEGTLLRKQPVSASERVFRAGAPFHSVFAVKTGAFKSVMPSATTPEQVVGFHLPGELIGLEGMASGTYPYTVSALDDASICALRIDNLPETSVERDKLTAGIIDLLSSEVAFQRGLAATLIHQSGEQRLAAFLIDLSERYTDRGLANVEISLPMSRADIASFLGLAPETVTRLLTRLQNSGLIDIGYRHVAINNIDALTALASSN